MSSGNYQAPILSDWYDHNRDKIIKAFDACPQVKLMEAKIKKLRKQIKCLEKIQDQNWELFRNDCCRKKVIPTKRKNK